LLLDADFFGRAVSFELSLARISSPYRRRVFRLCVEGRQLRDGVAARHDPQTFAHAANQGPLTMLRWLRQRADTGRKAEELYGSVVTAARQQAFYGRLGVPDTPEGRFELVAIHLFLALEALRGKGGEADELARRTIEAFVVDMDDCMREMGVGDLTVPKKVKRAAAGFYERAASYRSGLSGAGSLSTASPKLTEALRGYVYDGAGEREEDAVALAHYMQAASSALSDLEFEVFVNDGTASRLLAAATSKPKVSTT